MNIKHISVRSTHDCSKRLLRYMNYLFGIIVIVLGYLSFPMISYASESVTKTVPASAIYESDFDLSSGDKLYDANSVDLMSFGRKTFGSLEVSGQIDSMRTFNGIPAYGVIGNELKLSYKLDYSEVKGIWHLFSIDEKSFLGRDLKGKIRTGVMLIQKSETGKDGWTDVVPPILDIFSGPTDGLSDVDDFYRINSDSISKGSYYRIIIEYKSANDKPKDAQRFLDKYFFYRNIEVYTFYVCKNDPYLPIHNLSVDTDDYVTDGYSIEAVKYGETLTNGATTISGFSYKSAVSANEIRINNKPAEIENTITDNGKYSIDVQTKLGKKGSTTVYVFNGGSDKGYSTYFGDNHIQGQRVFKEGQYPSYTTGTKLVIQQVADSVPMLRGRFVNLTTGKSVALTASRSKREYDLDVGEYEADYFNGINESGSYYHYKFRFNIVDEKAEPHVNYGTLLGLNRTCDLNSKHYEVIYQTTRGGQISVCFANYDDAFSYAYEIQKRNIEIRESGTYYFPKDSDSTKIRYDISTDEGKIRLTEALNYYAEKNIEVWYFDPNDEYTYETLEEDQLADLERLSLSKSVKVFPSESEREKMRSGRSYLNQFQFVYVADYESNNVVAYCDRTKDTLLIRYGVPADDQLYLSSKYTIEETNSYGNTVTYDAWYLAKNDTVVKGTKIYNGDESPIYIDESNHAEIIADVLRIDEITNPYDENALITISSDCYSFDLKCLASEAEGLTLYEGGKYTIVFSDITGNSYSTTVSITGMASYSDAVDESAVTYTELFNQIHINLHMENEIIKLK